MKKNWFYFLLALPLMLFTACGDDDSDDEAPKNADTVVINDNGTTSNGSVYTPIDDKNFIPDNVVSLGNWCFAGCTQLTNLTLGSSLTNIGDQVFRGCPFLTAIHIKKETPIELNNTFDPAVYLSAILYIPKGYAGAYKTDEHWSAFQNIMEE